MTIHIAKNGQRYGTYTLEEVNAKLASGEVAPTDLAWQSGAKDWAAISTMEGIQLPKQSAATPPPPIPDEVPAPEKDPNAFTGKVLAGYICAGLSLAICPPGFGVAALVLGIMVRKEGNTHGSIIIILSVVCAIIGAIVGILVSIWVESLMAS